MTDHLPDYLRRHFGLESFREGQREAIEALVNGTDALAVLPTGSGKSLIYQLAALILDGPTLVVSPLLALQRDQIDAIDDNDIAPHLVLNSTLKESERKTTLGHIRKGRFEFLFLAPEQLANEEVHEAIQAAQPSLVVIDEAHCISQWGHDFRPEYSRLGEHIDSFGHPVTLALTATASKAVQDEIVEALGMRNPKVVTTSFDRPNISLCVERFTEETAKRSALLQAAKQETGQGIVYCATRRHVEDIAEALGTENIAAAAYHGGMKAAERNATQTAFMDGAVQILVATNAFGMGIDKPDIRFVFHYDVPDSVDSYYQEIGRAGRDDDPAEAKLFYRQEDFGVARFHAGGSDDRRNAHDKSRVEMMQRYAEARRCRRATLLSYFGQTIEPPCGNCDICSRTDTPEDAGGTYVSDQKVRHAQWGSGVVLTSNDETITVLFDEVGYKTLGVDLVEESNLLKLER